MRLGRTMSKVDPPPEAEKAENQEGTEWKCVWIFWIISFIKNFSPCLVLYKVITSRNTELIYFPQAFLGFINVTIWLCYSIWIEDVYQILSNGASALVCLFQLVIYWWINCSYNKVGIQDFESGPDIIN